MYTMVKNEKEKTPSAHALGVFSYINKNTKSSTNIKAKISRPDLDIPPEPDPGGICGDKQ